MPKFITLMIGLSLALPGAAWPQTSSSILPVKVGTYAPAEGGCDVAAAALIYISDLAIGANKTLGKVLRVRKHARTYSLDILWIEAGADEASGEQDTVQIEVQNDASFYFSNSLSDRTLMQRCDERSD